MYASFVLSSILSSRYRKYELVAALAMLEYSRFI